MAALLAAWVARRRPRVVIVCVLLALTATASALSARAWAGLDPVPPRSVSGWLTLRTDPERRAAGVTAIGELGGERYAVAGFGGAGRRLERFRAGDRFAVVGSAAPVSVSSRDRWVPRHVRNRLTIESVADTAPPAPLHRAANRVRAVLERGVADWPEADRALFLGLVIGDDRAQSDAIVEAFRSAGLSHLTAVSGQNVAFVLVAAAPVLQRLRPGARVGATLALIAWFATLTRFEPSVIRASGMAALAALVFWRGWSAAPIRLLAITVAGFTLIDPLLVHSVGWWLSVGATAGLAVGAARLGGVLPGPRWLADPLAVGLAAQLGVLPVSWLVFGRVALVGPLANLLAVPVAGFVMVWGIPAGLVAGAVPPLAGLLGAPGRAGTRWVSLVAQLAAQLEPGWHPAVVVAVHVATLAIVVGAVRRR